MPQTFHLDEDDEWEGTDVGPQEGRRGAEPFGHGWADRPSEPKVFAAARVAPKRTASDAPSTPARARAPHASPRTNAAYVICGAARGICHMRSAYAGICHMRTQLIMNPTNNEPN